MRILFNFVAICVGFLMVLGTVLLVTSIGAELLQMESYEIEARIILFCLVSLGFLFFAWIAGRFLRVVAPSSQPLVRRFGRSACPPPLGGAQRDSMNGDEARIMQEIYNGLTQMEKRIESLETILIDRHHETPWPAEK